MYTPLESDQTEQVISIHTVNVMLFMKWTYDSIAATPEALSRVIEMAWEDRTPFEAIETLYGLTEPQTIQLMRQSLKPKAFRNWRARVTGRRTKHRALRDPAVSRGYCPTQYKQR
jgi:uncharacterized protein (TIGR03643 family)